MHLCTQPVSLAKLCTPTTNDMGCKEWFSLLYKERASASSECYKRKLAILRIAFYMEKNTQQPEESETRFIFFIHL